MELHTKLRYWCGFVRLVSRIADKVAMPYRVSTMARCCFEELVKYPDGAMSKNVDEIVNELTKRNLGNLAADIESAREFHDALKQNDNDRFVDKRVS